MTQKQKTKFLAEMLAEASRIQEKGHVLHSLHEGYGLLLEELDEAWEEIKKKPKNRNLKELYMELVQVSTMAMRMADLCETKTE